MIRIFRSAFSRKRRNPFVDPEDIFLDTKNLPGFDTLRFEGRLERPIGRIAFIFMSVVFGLTGSALFARAAYLGYVRGDEFRERAETNHLRHISIVPPRGIIYDRSLVPLAYNVPGFHVIIDIDGEGDPLSREAIATLAEFMHKDPEELTGIIEKQIRVGGELPIGTVYDWDTANAIITAFKDNPRVTVEQATIREYSNDPAFSHVLGYVSGLTKEDIEHDNSMFLWPQRGRTGIEFFYDDLLRGQLGIKTVETNSLGEDLGEGVYEHAKPGKNIVLSISSDLQRVMYKAVADTVEERGFSGGSAVMLDAKTGAVLGMVSYPGFDTNALARGEPADVVRQTLSDTRHPLFNRAIGSAYPPASTIKPFLAAAALQERIIDPNQEILTEGKVVIPNPYNPDNPSIFLDWKNHGRVNMFKAIAVSSNAYFQTIGGGYKGIEGLGLSRIHAYLSRFGFGSKTGIDLPGEFEGLVPNEEWKAKNNPDNPVWRLGDTYNISIGQGGMLADPIQLAVAGLSLINGGDIIRPQVAIGTADDNGTIDRFSVGQKVRSIDIPESSLALVRKGMRMAVLEGTAAGLRDFSIEIAAKTGTAQYIKKERVHSWFVGFAPYTHPEVILVVNMENANAHNLIGGVYVAGQIFRWYTDHRDELAL